MGEQKGAISNPSEFLSVFLKKKPASIRPRLSVIMLSSFLDQSKSEGVYDYQTGMWTRKSAIRYKFTVVLLLA